MVNETCAFSQSELGKYFELIINVSLNRQSTFVGNMQCCQLKKFWQETYRLNRSHAMLDATSPFFAWKWGHACLKAIMAESMSTLEFWHRNLGDIPLFTNAFVEKMADENLPVKKTLTRGYIRQFLGGFVCLLSGRVSLWKYLFWSHLFLTDAWKAQPLLFWHSS